MSYRFYGWQTADVPPANPAYQSLRDPRALYDALWPLWRYETCAPRLRPDWSRSNPTLGQCSITAFLAQDIFGGRVLGVPLPDGNFHCFNVVDDCVFDLTSEQFGSQALCYEGCPEQRREVHFAKEEKRCRYEALKASLMLALNSIRTEECFLPGALGRLYGVLTLPGGSGPRPLVILSHGFGGDHRGPMDYAACFSRRGLACLALDFCGGGPGSLSGGVMTDMTVLTEAADLNAAIDHFQADPRFSEILLWGGSQGGFVSALVASGRPIRRMVLEFPAIVLRDDAKARRLPDGSFPPTSTVMGLTIGRCYNEAATSFDLYDRLNACSSDVLILHGDADPIVPLSYSQRAVTTLPHARLVTLPGQGHGFTGSERMRAMEMEAEFLLSEE